MLVAASSVRRFSCCCRQLCTLSGFDGDRVVFDWHFPLFGPDLASLGTSGVVVLFGRPTCGWSEPLVSRLSAPGVLEHVVSRWVFDYVLPVCLGPLCEPLVFRLYVLRACLAMRLLPRGSRVET
ncbi:hypothetical protein Taro_049215 [Colocasia esculenta]|uniref:Uncharacterized protein n=1 Tax=Colocasia esculenta TaxID=4460 RepID=A0A843XAB4_COLES|nr:hypothetical protein [Colocasia esculenta]